jgi:hypothetical protein
MDVTLLDIITILLYEAVSHCKGQKGLLGCWDPAQAVKNGEKKPHLSCYQSFSFVFLL